MKILVIPDIHLKSWIFDAAEQIMQDPRYQIDSAVCLGDLVDEWDCENKAWLYEQMLNAAIEFKRRHPDTLWCYGNHDIAYLWNRPVSGTSSIDSTSIAAYKGLKHLYQLPSFWDKETDHSADVSPDHFAFVHCVDHVIFSHGGVSADYVREHMPKISQACASKHGLILSYDDVPGIVSGINSLSAQDLWTCDYEPTFSSLHSPLWLRPQAQYQPLPVRMYQSADYLQVVGHTPTRGILKEHNVITCDTFSYFHGGLVGDQTFCVVDTQTLEWEVIPAPFSKGLEFLESR